MDSVNGANPSNFHYHILLIYILQCNVFFLILCCLWTICPCLVHVRFTQVYLFMGSHQVAFFCGSGFTLRSDPVPVNLYPNPRSIEYTVLMAKKCCPIFVVVYIQEIVLYVQEILSNFYRTICVVKFSSYTNYWAVHILPQIYTANHATFPIQIHSFYD